MGGHPPIPLLNHNDYCRACSAPRRACDAGRALGGLEAPHGAAQQLRRRGARGRYDSRAGGRRTGARNKGKTKVVRVATNASRQGGVRKAHFRIESNRVARSVDSWSIGACLACLSKSVACPRACPYVGNMCLDGSAKPRIYNNLNAGGRRQAQRH